MDPLREKPVFCSACGAPLGGTPFCGQCGAKVVVTAVHTPAPVEEVTPVEEVAPVAEPIFVAEPLAQAAPAPRKFPLIPVILMGIVVLMNMITMIGYLGSIDLGSMTFAEMGNLSATFILQLLEVCCLIVLLVGMIVCRRPRNLIVAITFLAMVPLSLISTGIAIPDYVSIGLDVATIVAISLPSVLSCLCYIIFGVTYLVAKPRIAILKNVACAVFVGFFLLTKIVAIITNRGDGAFALIADFLLYTVTFYLAVFLYTPFRKK